MSADLPSVTIGIYLSSDGTTPESLLQMLSITNSAELRGGPGDDFLYGEAGDDDLDGQEGFDTLDGGTGVNDPQYVDEQAFQYVRPPMWTIADGPACQGDYALNSTDHWPSGYMKWDAQHNPLWGYQQVYLTWVRGANLDTDVPYRVYDAGGPPPPQPRDPASVVFGLHNFEYRDARRVVLMPSLWRESFGRVAAEALLNGIPVLATRRGALPEVLREAGFLFDIPERYTPESRIVPSPEEVAPWVETVIRLWDDAAVQEAES